MKRWKRAAVLAAMGLALALAGCGGEEAARDEQVFVLGDTTFNGENEEFGVDPHEGYSGWAAVRYGVGETLLRCTDAMETEPWLADRWERLDDRTWRFHLREGVRFTSGRAMDGEAVKECLEALIAKNRRAREELRIASISAEGQTVTLTTDGPNPSLLHRLCDPYACIVDVRAPVGEGLAAGTGPFRAAALLPGERLELVRNDAYWAGLPRTERAVVHTLSNGDTLTMALQSGAIDGAYGLPYASYPLFENEGYHISRTATSRVFFLQMNMRSPLGQDGAVRHAVARCLDREGFVKALLGGHGYPASGPYPAGFAFAAKDLHPAPYDPAGAAALLEAAGWRDTDGDGIREKDGRPLVLRWLTYPSRQELPLLAEAAQAAMKRAGIAVEIVSSPAHTRLRGDPSAWDVYASALVTAPAGDPLYFFQMCAADGAPANFGGFHHDGVEQLLREGAETFDEDRRRAISMELQRLLAESGAFLFVSHLEMGLVTRAGVHHFTAHPCDLYEITKELEVTGGA